MEQKYLLRIWDGDMQNEAWQASLKNIETKETEFFTDLKSFKDFFAARRINSDIFLSNGDFNSGLSE